MDLNIGQNKWEEIMSVKDTIKKSVLESGTFAQYDMLKIMLAMTIALLMGCLIYMVYKKVLFRSCVFKKFCGDLSGNVCADMYGNSGDQHQYCISLRYGRRHYRLCVIVQP